MLKFGVNFMLKPIQINIIYKLLYNFNNLKQLNIMPLQLLNIFFWLTHPAIKKLFCDSLLFKEPENVLWLVSSEFFNLHSHLIHFSRGLRVFMLKYDCMHSLNHLLDVVQSLLLLLRKFELWLFKLRFKIVSKKINMMSEIVNVWSVLLNIVKDFIRVINEVEMIFNIDHFNLLNTTDFSNLFDLVVQKVMLMLLTLINICLYLILSLNHLLLQSWNITLKLFVLLVQISLNWTFIFL